LTSNNRKKNYFNYTNFLVPLNKSMYTCLQFMLSAYYTKTNSKTAKQSLLTSSNLFIIKLKISLLIKNLSTHADYYACACFPSKYYSDEPHQTKKQNIWKASTRIHEKEFTFLLYNFLLYVQIYSDKTNMLNKNASETSEGINFSLVYIKNNLTNKKNSKMFSFSI
jgi:hypothetical protein